MKSKSKPIGEADKEITKAKTLCCDADWYIKSRADFRCEKCERDVTLEIMFLYDS